MPPIRSTEHLEQPEARLRSATEPNQSIAFEAAHIAAMALSTLKALETSNQIIQANISTLREELSANTARDLSLFETSIATLEAQAKLISSLTISLTRSFSSLSR